MRVGGTGNPDFSVDFGDVKPTALVVAAAALMLSLGKPLSGAKTFGKMRFNVPKLDSDGTATVRIVPHPGATLTASGPAVSRLMSRVSASVAASLMNRCRYHPAGLID